MFATTPIIRWFNPVDEFQTAIIFTMAGFNTFIDNLQSGSEVKLPFPLGDKKK
jgi:hypothetical protein